MSLPLTEEELTKMFEESKLDTTIIVGSDVRRLVGEVRRLRVERDEAREQIDNVWKLSVTKAEQMLKEQEAQLTRAVAAQDEITARTLHLAHGLRKNGTKLYIQVAELLESFCSFPLAGEHVIRIVERHRDDLMEEGKTLRHQIEALSAEVKDLEKRSVRVSQLEHALETAANEMQDAAHEIWPKLDDPLGGSPLRVRDAARDLQEAATRVKRELADVTTHLSDSIDSTTIWTNRCTRLAKLLDGCYGVCAVCNERDHVTSEHITKLLPWDGNYPA